MGTTTCLRAAPTLWPQRLYLTDQSGYWFLSTSAERADVTRVDCLGALRVVTLWPRVSAVAQWEVQAVPTEHGPLPKE